MGLSPSHAILMVRDRLNPHWVFSFAFVGMFALYVAVLSLNSLFFYYSPLKRTDKQRFQQLFVLQKLFQVQEFTVNSLF